MGRPTPHDKVCLIVGMLSAWPELFARAAARLSERAGAVWRESAPIDFTFSDYYAKEMGPRLTRKFFTFERLIDPVELVDFKLWTNDLEAELAGPPYAVPRPINLDPGYVDLAKLVLASTKDYAHRICVGRGIYAEVTLSYTRGAWQAQPWTYPDYRSAAYLDVLNAVRADYQARIKAAGREA